MSPKPVFLDVDSSIVERNLRITEDPNEEFNKLFESEHQYPSKVVKPFPGFCVKTKEVGTETKIFINICYTDAIPPPKDISEEELGKIWNSSDESCEYRIPMSIGDVRMEQDKKGESAKAIDIAIHPKFFTKIENSIFFKNFFMAVAFEGLQNKHKIHTTDNFVVLKNKKAFGTLQLHRIQQREIDEKMGGVKGTYDVLNELTAKTETGKLKPKIETLSSITYDENEKQPPDYRLFKRIGEPNVLIGEFKLLNILESSELTLDIGEDRIILESSKRGYFLDIFISYDVVQDEVTSTFDRNSKVLTVTMPIKLDKKCD